MKTADNAVLITGGATGIGLSLARAFLDAGNRVLICGRSKDRLLAARQALPLLETLACDVSGPGGRESLFSWASMQFSAVSILVNNAGIQKRIDFATPGLKYASLEEEINTNFAAPIDLCARFIPLLAAKAEAAIINVSSGLGFVPIADMPVYCATKAALHSFSLSLRHQLRGTTVKVFEIIPPRVDTGLGRVEGEIMGGYPGIQPAAVAESAMAALAADLYEVAVGEAGRLVDGSRRDPEGIFGSLNP